MTSQAAISLVHRMAGREPPRRSPPDLSRVEITDEPLPPPKKCGTFLGRGAGPWQRLAQSLKVGQSVKVTAREAESFRTACKRLQIRTASRKLDDGRVQVQIVSKQP